MDNPFKKDSVIKPMSIILHVDMDAFYASVEEVRNPELKGKPLIIGADPKEGTGRGVVATCNYAARKFGVRSALPISRAWKLCPQGTYIRPDFRQYSEVSKRVMELLRSFSSVFQKVSIDEAYLDMSTHSYDDVRRIAQLMKDAVEKQEGITCSIGVGANKLLAKIASDHDKPNGLTVVTPDQVLDFLAPLPVKVLRGVGPKTRERMTKLGLKTVLDVRKKSQDFLTKHFHSFGLSLYNQSRGIASARLVTKRVPKSISKETTFYTDTNDSAEIDTALQRVIDGVHASLLRKKMQFRTVSLKLRFEDFATFTRARSVLAPTAEKVAISNIARKLLRPFLQDKRKIRLIGVGVKGLK